MRRTLLTPEGYKKVTEELENIKKIEIPRVDKRVKEAMEYGDSGMIEDAILEQSFYKQRINVLTKMLNEAEIVEVK